MHATSLRLRVVLVAAASGVSGCTPSTAPVDSALQSFSGTFVLQSLDGAPLPVLRAEYSDTRQYLTADTLTADGQGQYTRVTITRTDSVGGTYRATQRTAQAGRYAVRGDTIDFPVTCPPGALCVLTPVGWRMADGSLVIAYRSTEGFHLVSHFARVR